MVNIAAGDKVLIEFSTFGDRFLCVVTDLGDDGEFLVYVPVPERIIRRLKTDRSVFVRYAQEGVLRGFKSRVLNKVESNNTIFQIGAAETIIDAEDRSEPRCSCRFPAIVVDDERAAEAVVEDMSKSCSRVRFINGGLFDSETASDNVQLKFHPFDTEDGYSVGCNVRNAFMKNGQHYAVLEFNAEERDARKRIARFIEAQVCCGIPRL